MADTLLSDDEFFSAGAVETMDDETFLRLGDSKGGLRDDEGYDLRKGRNMGRLAPGKGVIEFPDDMDSDAIGAAIQTSFPDLSPKMGAWDTAKAIGGQIGDAVTHHLPGAVAAAIEGDDPYAERDWKDALIERSRAKSQERAQAIDPAKPTAIPGVTAGDVGGLGPSLGFSGVGMGAGLGVGMPAAIAGTLAAPGVGTAAGIVAGGGASGLAAHRMSTNQFVRDLRDTVDADRRQRGEAPIGDDEFAAKATELAPLIREYGLWEAVPEAAGNVIGFGVLKAPVAGAIGKAFGKNITTRLASKAAALYGSELATETVTQQGQHNVEVDAGMATGPHRDWTDPADIGASFKEVAAPTILQTTLMGGAAKGGMMALQNFAGRRGRVAPGIREAAAAEAPPLSEDDKASPIADDLIAAGRQSMADAGARKEADAILSGAGVPGIDTRVSITAADGSAMAGTVVDAFSQVERGAAPVAPEGAEPLFDEDGNQIGHFNPQTGRTFTGQPAETVTHGIKIRLDDGRLFEARFDELGRAGIRVNPILALDGPAQEDRAALPAPERNGARMASGDGFVMQEGEDRGQAALPSPYQPGFAGGDGFTYQDPAQSPPRTMKRPRGGQPFRAEERNWWDNAPAEVVPTNAEFSEQGDRLTGPDRVERAALPAPSRSGATVTDIGGAVMRGPEQDQRALPSPNDTLPDGMVMGDGFTYAEGGKPARPIKRTAGEPFRPDAPQVLPRANGVIAMPNLAGDQVAQAPETAVPAAPVAPPSSGQQVETAPASARSAPSDSVTVMRKDGTPFPDAKTARNAIKLRKDLKGRAFDVVAVDGGYALREKAAAVKERKAPAQRGPVDAIRFLASKGGLRDDEGYDLRKGRNMGRLVPGKGPLLRPTGMTIDAAGEALWDAGYFGPTETTPRPSESEVLDFIERAAKDKQFSDNDRSEVQAQEDDAETVAVEAANAQAMAELEGFLAEHDLVVSEVVKLDALANVGAGLSQADAVTQAIKSDAIAAAEEYGFYDDSVAAGEIEEAPFNEDDYEAYRVGEEDAREGDDSSAQGAGRPAAQGQEPGDRRQAGSREGQDLRGVEVGEAIGADARPNEARAATRTKAQELLKRQQSKIRKGGQESIKDQDGGLFAAERDQGDLLAAPAKKLPPPKSERGGRADADIRALPVADLTDEEARREYSTIQGDLGADYGYASRNIVPGSEESRRLNERKIELMERLGYLPWQRTAAEMKSTKDMPSARHRRAVEEALEAGKPVPERVLADYPDLVPTSEVAEGQTREGDGGRVEMFQMEGDGPRKLGIPREAGKAISSHSSMDALRAHPDYRAAKSGDAHAAVRLVSDLVQTETAKEARRRFGPDVVFAAAMAEESSGANAIPRTLAEYYAAITGGTVDGSIVQAVRANHTSASPMERLTRRPIFTGPVTAGSRYVLVDDVSTMGGTLAEMANHIRSNGGEVAGVIVLANTSRTGLLSPNRVQVREIERRYGDVVREVFGIDPAGLTADEATYILNSRDADTLRDRAAKAAQRGSGAGGASGVRASEDEKRRVGADTLQSGQFNNLETALRSRLSALGLSDKVTLQVVEAVRSMTTGKAQAGAAGSFFQNIIQVAAGGSNPMLTLNHEAIHALRANNILRGLDWKALEKMARADTALMERVRRDYAGLNLSQEALTEEAVAEMFAAWATGRAPKGMVGRAFERVAAFFAALRAALKDSGLIESIREGRAAARAVGVMQDIDGGRMRGEDGRFMSERSTRFHAAWHGSPHDHNGFSTAKIGTGEGAQAYGWGLYFAGARSVAEYYRNVLRKAHRGLRWDGRNITEEKILEKLNEEFGRGSSYQSGVALSEFYASGDAAIAKNNTVDDLWPIIDFLSEHLKVNAGRLYKVELAPKDDEYLDWDKPLREQSNGVKEKLQALSDSLGDDFYDTSGFHLQDGTLEDIGTSDDKASRFYKALDNHFDSDKAASLALHDAGIPGIRYLDGSSRAAGEGNSNYVIFDESNVTIEEKFDINRRQGPVPSGAFARMVHAPQESVVEAIRHTTGSLMDKIRAAGSRQAMGESFDRWRVAMQDQFLSLLRVQTAIEKQLGRKLAESEMPYLTQELSSGRKGAQLEDLADGMVRPLFEAMHAEGVTVAEIEEYLYARHAPERNARIARINPNFAAGEGSGLTDAEAAEIMAAANAAGKLDALERLAAKVDEMTAFALDTRVKAGLLSEEEARAWRDAYKHYVPLRGEAELDSEMNADRPRSGSGINVKGKESQRAFGRKSKAGDILAYTIMQAEEAIIRAETNKVAQDFHALAKAAPDAEFWTIDKVEKRAVFNKATGQVEYRAINQITAEDKDYTVSLKIDGKEHRVTLNRKNPVAARLAEAMRSLSDQKMNFVVATMGQVNRYLSTVNTSLNPEFVITNAFRDLQHAVPTLAQYDMPGLIKSVLKDYPSALKGSLRGAFGKHDGKWTAYYDEFREAGGRVYFNRVDDIRGLRTRVEKDFTAAKPGWTAKKAIVGLFRGIERINQGVESAIRLSAYKNAREAGMSVALAASLAKNLTVNFNRRGTYGPLINSMYLFYNASVQGTATILLAAKSRRVQKILAGAVVTGALLEFLNAMASDDDDDGEKFYDKISHFDKSKNIILMLPGAEGKHIKIPLPYGYNVFFAAGRAMAEVARGKNALESAATLAVTTLESFNPIGGAGNILSVISPTLADPIVDLFRNRDFADRPIMPDDKQFGPKVPDSQRYWGSVSPIWKAVTDTLNSVTGGDEVKPGKIDVSPETLEYLWGVTTGATGSFYVGRVAGGVAKMFDPTADLSWNDAPLARKVVGSAPSWYNKATFYERLAEVEQEKSYVVEYTKRGERDLARETMESHKNLIGLNSAAAASRQAMSEVRQAKAAISRQRDMGRATDAQYAEKIKALKEREAAIVTRFNRLYVERVLTAEE